MVLIAWAEKNMKLCCRGKVRLWAGCVLVALFFVAAMLGKYWVIPKLVTQRLGLEMGKVWDGEATIEKVEFHYFAPTLLRDITLRDRQGRCWLNADALRVTLKGTLRLAPAIEALAIDHLRLNAYLQDGQLAIGIPSADPTGGAADGTAIDVDRILISELTIAVEDEHGSAIGCESLQFFAERLEKGFEVSLTQLPDSALDRFSVAGSINPTTMEVDLLCEMDRAFTKTETAVLGSILGIPKDYQAEGKVGAHLTLSGPLSDPGGLTVVGTVQLDDGVVLLGEQVLLEEGRLLVQLDDHVVDVNLVGAAFCGGRLEGAFNMVDTQAVEKMEFGGYISGQEIAVAEVMALMGGQPEASKGGCTFRYQFSGKQKDLSDLQGQGVVDLLDTRIKGVSVMPKIIQFLGLKGSEEIAASDGAMRFTHAGLTVTLQEARVANPVLVVRAEPGGTVDLQTGQLDLFVIAVPLSEIDDFLRGLPMTDIVINLKDKLARLHIQGHWSQPPGKLITKEPMTDIKEGTVGLLKDIVASPGKITEGIFKAFQKPPAAKDEETQ